MADPATHQETATHLDSAPSAGPPRSAAFIVFLVVFIDLLGFGIVLPLMPLYTTELLEPLYPGEAAMQGLLLGLLMASFSLMQFLFAPVWGRLSDRIGRRPILLLGLVASVLFYGLFGIASELGTGERAVMALTLLFVARIGAGIAGATIATAQAVIADVTPPEKRAHGMALVGIAFGIGFTFGPLLGFASLFLEDRRGMPGFAAAGLSLVAAILAFVLLPETVRPGVTGGRRHWLDLRSMREVLAMPTVGLLVGTFFLATWAFGGLESTLALMNKMLLNPDADLRQSLTREALRTTEKNSFLIFAFVGLVLMLAQGLIYRRLVGKVGEVAFLRLGAMMMTLGLVAVIGLTAAVHYRTVVETGLIWGVALPILTLCVTGFAFMTPSVQALISQRSDPTRQGEVLGVNQSASAMARILGPMVGLFLFKLHPSHMLPYVFGAVLLVVVFLLTLKIRRV